MRKLSPKLVHEILSEIGRKGGQSGTGKVKSRGNSAYYKRIRASRKSYPKKV